MQCAHTYNYYLHKWSDAIVLISETTKCHVRMKYSCNDSNYQTIIISPFNRIYFIVSQIQMCWKSSQQNFSIARWSYIPYDADHLQLVLEVAIISIAHTCAHIQTPPLYCFVSDVRIEVASVSYNMLFHAVIVVNPAIVAALLKHAQ